MLDDATARDQLLDAADRLFYARGVRAVGMDAVSAEAGVSLKKMYAVFPSKDALLIAVLLRRTTQWDDGIARAAASAGSPEAKLLAVYDFLDTWFRAGDFRGCAFINAFAELGAVSPEVAAVARRQKESFQRYVGDLVTELGAAQPLAAQLAILAEGAQTTAAISGSPDAAAQARAAAEVLIRHAVY